MNISGSARIELGSSYLATLIWLDETGQGAIFPPACHNVLIMCRLLCRTVSLHSIWSRIFLLLWTTKVSMATDKKMLTSYNLSRKNTHVWTTKIWEKSVASGSCSFILSMYWTDSKQWHTEHYTWIITLAAFCQVKSCVSLSVFVFSSLIRHNAADGTLE